MIKNKLVKDISLSFVAQIIIMLSAFAINKIMSIKLGVDGYGVFSIIKRSTAVISFMSLFGMGIALPKYLAHYLINRQYSRLKSTVYSGLLIVLGASFIIILTLICFNSFFKSYVSGVDTQSSKTYYITLFYSFSLSIYSFVLAYFRGVDRFFYYTMSQLAIQILLVAIAVSCSSLNWIFLFWGLTYLFVSIGFYLQTRTKDKYIYDGNKHKPHINRSVKFLFVYGFPRMVGDFLLFSYQAFPLVYIGLNMSTSAVAIFSVGLTISVLISPVFSFVGTALLPFVSRSVAANEKGKAVNSVNTLLIIYIVMSSLCVIFIYLFDTYLIELLFSKSYIEASKLTKILVLSLIPSSIYSLLRNPIDALSIRPYNTLALFIGFAMLIVLFNLSSTLEQFATSFVIASFVRGAITLITWKIIK